MNEDKPVRIIRAAHERDYFVFSRKTAQDANLSYEALGVLAYLLSKSDSWEANVKDLAKRSSSYKVYKILRELRQAGYLTLSKEQGKGRYSQWVYQVYETAQQLIEFQQVENQLIENRHTKIVQKNSDSTEKKRDTRKRVTPPSNSKQKPLPAKRKDWQWEHIERYALENPDVDRLAAFDTPDMSPALKQLPLKSVALDCIELYEELLRNGIEAHRYNALYLGTTIKVEYSVFKCMLWHLPNYIKNGNNPAHKQKTAHERMIDELKALPPEEIIPPLMRFQNDKH